jgi:hypothetical protein
VASPVSSNDDQAISSPVETSSIPLFTSPCIHLFNQLKQRAEDYGDRTSLNNDGDFRLTDMGHHNKEELIKLHRTMGVIFEKIIQHCPYQEMKKATNQPISGLDTFETIYNHSKELK